jgi:hypothetical protein
MEEKELKEVRELACKAIMAKRWIGAAQVDTTSMDMEHLKLDVEPENVGSWDVPTSHYNVTWDAVVVGRSAGEKFYVMELNDMMEEYWNLLNHQGLVCTVPGLSRDEAHEHRLVSPTDDIARIPLSSQTVRLVMSAPTKRHEYRLPQALADFCLRHKIQGYVQVAIDLVKRHFQAVSEVHLQPEVDPDTGEEWLVVDLTTEGDIDEILACYDKYTNHWVSSVPWPERNKIRLSYDIV